VADEVKSEEPRIEPYYQGQGKYLVDTLFDLGCLSESLSRDGLVKVEDLAALMFQQIADSANRCAGFTKKYKKSGHDEGERVRHEEEMRWISRAKEAELDIFKLRDEIEHLKAFIKADSANWLKNTIAFLRKIVVPWPEADSARAQDEVAWATRLLNDAFDLGIAEPDCSPGKEFFTSKEFHNLTRDKYRPGEGLRSNMEPCPENPCHGEVFEGPIQPGEVINICPKCGGRIL
jgi:hypothetical protein